MAALFGAKEEEEKKGGITQKKRSASRAECRTEVAFGSALVGSGHSTDRPNGCIQQIGAERRRGTHCCDATPRARAAGAGRPITEWPSLRCGDSRECRVGAVAMDHLLDFALRQCSADSADPLASKNSLDLSAAIQLLKSRSDGFPPLASDFLFLSSLLNVNAVSETKAERSTSPAHSASSSSGSAIGSLQNSPSNRRAIRKPPAPIPDAKKDLAYYERRKKNNDAAKRSRDARRLKEEQTANRAAALERENISLNAEVAHLKSEISRLRLLLFSSTDQKPTDL